MPAKTVIPPGLSASQYEQIFAGAGTYEGNNKAYKGKSWGDVYAAIWAADQQQHAGLSAYQVALKVEILVILQGGVGALTSSVANFVNQAGQAAANTNFAAGVPGGGGLLSGLAAIGDFFSRLTQANTWIRVAEVLLGAGLIIVGLAHLAANTPVGRAAAKAGKAAMLL